MRLSWTTLFVTESTWTIGFSDDQLDGLVLLEEVDISVGDTAEGVAAAIRLAKEAGAKVGPLVVGLTSPWCFGATLSSDGLSRRQRRQGLIYRMEEVLPVDAEAITTDFITAEENVFGVAVLHAKVKPLLDALEAEGLSVAHFCPTSLLALEAHRNAQGNRATDDTTSCYFIATDNKSIDIVAMSEGHLKAWRSLTADSELIEAEIQGMPDATENATKTISLGLPNALDWRNESPGEPDPKAINDLLKQTTRYAHKILSTGQTPFVDLRRDTLSGQRTWERIGKSASATMAALLLLLVSVGMVNTWNIHRYDRLAERYADTQAALFRETFPGQTVPSAILSRFRSEAAKAEGLTGRNGDMPSAATTLQDLQRLLAGLPDRGPETSTSQNDHMRFRILELRLEPDRLYLDGQTRSHADADRLAAGLGQQVAYTIEPPRTQNLSASVNAGRAAVSGRSTLEEQGVGFTLTGHREVNQP